MKNKTNSCLDNFFVSINAHSQINFKGNSVSDDYDVFIKVNLKDRDNNRIIGGLTIGVVHNNNGRRSFNNTMDYIDGFNGSLYNCLEAVRYDEDDFAISNKELHEAVIDYINDGHDILYVDEVYVAPKFRKKGLAKAMLSKIHLIIDAATGCFGGIVLLAARPQEILDTESSEFDENEKILFNLYEKSGFTRIQDNVFIRLLNY